MTYFPLKESAACINGFNFLHQSAVSKRNHSHGVKIYGHKQTNPDFGIAMSIFYGCYPTVNKIPLMAAL